MSHRWRTSLGILLVAVSMGACRGGSSSVYVGLSDPGPWVGYPHPYPGVPGVTLGFPPRYWDGDEDREAESGTAEDSGPERDAREAPGPGAE